MRFTSLSLLALLPGALGLVPVLHEDSPLAIPNQYIIVYKKDVSLDSIRLVEGLIATAPGSLFGRVFSIVSFKGCSAKLPPSLLNVLRTKDDTVRRLHSPR